jgi:hypothetical protein
VWHPFKEGSTIGTPGSEAGTIVLDDEHAVGGRITLERDGRTPFAITCGIYGWMMHTRFFSNEAEARLAFDAMKEALATIVRSIPSTNDPDCEAKIKGVPDRIRAFVDRFP